MSHTNNDNILKNEMRGYINTLIRNGTLKQDDILPKNWDNIKTNVINISNDKRYNHFTYDHIYNQYIINKGGRRKSRKNRRKSKKSRKHPRKSKRHSRR